MALVARTALAPTDLTAFRADLEEITRRSNIGPQEEFITGDGWFTYNLVTNLAKRPTA